MKVSFILFLLFVQCLVHKAKAGEGMWLLPLVEELNFESMRRQGVKIPPSDIFNTEQGSIKDAVVKFGGICTGVMISGQGLLLTNHHCGFGQIQDLSSVDNNLLDNGFWAATNADELHAPGLEVSFLKKMEDVTGEILSVVTAEMNREERQAAIDKKRGEIEKAASTGIGYNAMVRDFFAGSKFFLVVYQEFKDVRLVGTPPNSIGKFGHDTDNWMWPRQTGDFALFRVYTDSLGNPAEYSPYNIPMKTDEFLPISLKGYEEGDFAMIIGFPGRTHRYLTSWGINERVEIFNRALITARGKRQEIWAEAMLANDQVRLQYADKFARSSNHWKNSIGMNRALETLNVIEQRQELESSFAKWVEEDSARQNVYGNVLSNFKEAYSGRAGTFKALIFLRETLVRGAELLAFASNATELESALKTGDTKTIEDAISRLRETGEQFYRDYHPPTDRLVITAKLPLFANEVAEEHWPTFYQTINGRFRGNYQRFTDHLFKNSLFACNNRFNSFLENPNLKKLSRDPAFAAGKSVMERYRQLTSLNQGFEARIAEATRLLIKGLKEMQPERVFYPDANFTMRLSYGKIGGYSPRDGVTYHHYTTLEGVMEKEDPDNFEFVVPEKLKQLHRERQYGKYAAPDGRMKVNFISANDITGGNSGSPVINAEGHLIGLAFDGNWESMSGDIAFVHGIQKSINVDIRYVLFVIDKFAGASHLLNEMKLIK